LILSSTCKNWCKKLINKPRETLKTGEPRIFMKALAS
jgi:hypothetical protein